MLLNTVEHKIEHLKINPYNDFLLFKQKNQLLVQDKAFNPIF